MNPKKFLLQAIRTLLEKHPFEDITVDMILQEADVSRGTFYKYYRDKYDLANSYYSDYVSSEIVSHYNGHNWKQCLKEIFLFVKENRDYFKTVIINRNTAFLDFVSSFGLEGYQRVYMANMHIAEMSDEQIMESEFYNAGCVRILELWIMDDCRMPVDRLVQLSCSLMPDIYTRVAF